MYRLLTRILRRLVFTVVDAALILPSFIQVRLLRAHKSSQVLHEGKRTARQRDVAIVALFAPTGLLPTTRRLLEALRKRNVAIIAVSNADLPDRDLEYLKRITYAVIRRPNIGRDFGCYQCGWEFLVDRNISARKLFMVNDSTYYLPGIDRIIAVCQQADDSFQGLTENFEYAHHLSSYFLVFTEEVTASPCFKSFWRTYRPYSTRMHAIFKGEIALSQMLIASGGFVPRVMFNANALRFQLQKAEGIALMEDCHRHAPADLSDLSREFTAIVQNKSLQEITEEAPFWKSIIIERWIDYGEVRNQTHAFALLFPKYLDCALLKRDLCQRGSYRISTLVDFLSNYLESGELDLIEKDLRAKAYPVSRQGVKRLLFDAGRI